MKLKMLTIALCLSVGCQETTHKATQPAEPSEPVEVRAFLDKAVATTGDQITYTVEVERDKPIEVEIAEPGAEIAGLRILDSQIHPPEEDQDRVIERRTYLLRADLVGSYVLPEVQATYRMKKGEGQPEPEPVTVKTSRIFLEVKSVLPKDGSVTDIRDIKPLERPDFGLPGWAWMAMCLIGLSAGAAVFWSIQRRRRTTGTPPAPAPHQVAFAALDALRATDFEDQKALRRYYFAICETVRQYVESRFGLNATDLTTTEILERASGIEELGLDERGLLKNFLVHTDLVKFAHHQPIEDEIRECYDHAVQFVQRTVPASPPDSHERRAA